MATNLVEERENGITAELPVAAILRATHVMLGKTINLAFEVRATFDVR